MKKVTDYKDLHDLQMELRTQVSNDLPDKPFTCGWFLNALGVQEFTPIGDTMRGANYKVEFKGIIIGELYITKETKNFVLNANKPEHVTTLRGRPVNMDNMPKLYVHSDVFHSPFKPHRTSSGYVQGVSLGDYEFSADILPHQNLTGIERLYSTKIKAHIFDLDTETGETASILSLRGTATLVLHVIPVEGSKEVDLKIYLFSRTAKTQKEISKKSLGEFIKYVKRHSVHEWAYNGSLKVWISEEHNANSVE